MTTVRVLRATAFTLTFALAACGGCGNCTVPPYTAPTGTVAFVAPTPTPLKSPAPGKSASPAPPVSPAPSTSPSPALSPLPLPSPVPSPSPSPSPSIAPVIPPPTAAPTVLLTCAQNAVSGNAVPLGTDITFAVLGGSTVTNSGLTFITGNVGVSPGAAISGFGAGAATVSGGVIDDDNPAAAQAQLDLTTAYNNAAGRVNPIAVPADIGGMVLAPGTYKAPVSLAITGNVTLDGQLNPNSVFIFQMSSTLTTSVGSTVTLINDANACNVFWQVGSSASLNANSVFNGAIMALASVSLGTGAVVNGRLLARNGAVTLLNNTVTETGP